MPSASLPPVLAVLPRTTMRRISPTTKIGTPSTTTPRPGPGKGINTSPKTATRPPRTSSQVASHERMRRSSGDRAHLRKGRVSTERVTAMPSSAANGARRTGASGRTDEMDIFVDPCLGPLYADPMLLVALAAHLAGYPGEPAFVSVLKCSTSSSACRKRQSLSPIIVGPPSGVHDDEDIVVRASWEPLGVRTPRPASVPAYPPAQDLWPADVHARHVPPPRLEIPIQAATGTTSPRVRRRSTPRGCPVQPARPARSAGRWCSAARPYWRVVGRRWRVG
jgi:hypothetical protein